MRLTRKDESVEERGVWCDVEGAYLDDPHYYGPFDHYGYGAPCEGPHYDATVVVDRGSAVTLPAS